METTKITIGRSPECDIVVGEVWDTVSNEHADIVSNGTELTLVDHSSNGTVINGQKIHNISVGIYPGDVIKLAGKFVVEWSELIRFFPHLKRPTVVKNVRAEGVATPSRPTVQRENEAQSVPDNGNKARETERFMPHSTDNAPHGNAHALMNPAGQAVRNSYSQAEVDDLTSSWSWPGFLCAWVWSAFHGIYYPLALIPLAFIPYVGQVAALAVMVYLGMNGARWAWAKGRVTTFDKFLSSQRRWTVVGVVVLVLRIVAHCFILYHMLSLL